MIRNPVLIAIMCLLLTTQNQAESTTLLFSDLNGWTTANIGRSLPDILSIKHIQRLPIKQKNALKNIDSTNLHDIKTYLETYYTPTLITHPDYENLITGYHAPHYKASKTKTRKFKFPVYKHPKTKKLPHIYSHKDILKGALKNKDLELFWLSSQIDVYFLMIQGSGILHLQNKSRVHVQVHGSNQLPYKSVSQYMIDKKIITESQRNAPTIRQKLSALSKRKQRHILGQNPSYAFFQIKSTPEIKGSANTSLIPHTSIAIDRSFYLYHSLFWLETEIPKNSHSKSHSTSLVISHDRGGAIKGPQRADIYFGQDKHAETQAGYMKDFNARLIYLKPNTDF